MRTHYCGHIKKKDISQKITICGWIHKKRNIGKVLFIDVRDRSGIIQVVFIFQKNNKLFQLAETLKNESCIKIFGKVQERSFKNKNLNIKTGEIEVIAIELKIFNYSKKLPFDINNITSKKNKLKFRYLDIRQTNILNNLKIRHLIVNNIISFLNKNKFLNIETPFLTSSTPEGARDYLVPSRIYPKKFYALPQSPQLFKQLLMISGIDRYYQIVKCFRDEDLRANRQPEFTQIDIEVSFMSESKLRYLMEKMISQLWLKIKNVKLKKMKIMSFHESIKKFGTDKPDLRNPIKLFDIHNFLKKEFIFKDFDIKKHRIISFKIPNGMKIKSQKINLYVKEIKKNNVNSIHILEIKNFTIFNFHTKKIIFENINKNEIKKIIQKNQLEKNDLLVVIYGFSDLVNKICAKIRDIIARDLKIINSSDWSFVWIKHFPLFKKNNKNSFSSVHHPFTSPLNNNIEELIKNPKIALSNSYDMIINGQEIGGGSIRIHKKKIQEIVFKIIGLNKKIQKEKFGFFLRSLKYGTPPHAGIAFGLDRITMLLTDSKNISDVIAFPKTTSARCLITGAPHYLKK
ncbi:aspartate--tRNA ligase [Buchnera aphidicola]|uniref:aspartate--tRNA ligase n=1 Tax=Buchnera aphidicola TaxID=9 RepID=UPI002543E09F|nr:aspartate--tRNA ligase [Buchnera aphidicola]WII23496.1 aspartate--tRNA ligase [Buchnera aphidicola (Sipha maydis)]